MSREHLAARIPLPASCLCGPVHYSLSTNNRTCLPCFVFYANNDAFCLKSFSVRHQNCAKKCENLSIGVEPKISLKISLFINKCSMSQRIFPFNNEVWSWRMCLKSTCVWSCSNLVYVSGIQNCLHFAR